MCHSLSITVGPGGGHSIRQFVEFEAKQSGSILIFALSDEARLMRCCPPESPAQNTAGTCCQIQPTAVTFLPPDWPMMRHKALLLAQSRDLKLIESCNGKPEYSAITAPC